MLCVHVHDRKCSNCGTYHKPCQCPAYRDACNSCGAIGQWEKCCRKKRKNQQTRKPSDSGTQRGSHSSKRNKHGKHNKGNKAANKAAHSLETGYETGGESYQQEFYAVNLSSKSLDSLGQDKKSRDEAYTRLKIRPPGIRTKNCSLLLKIDTGASGNTLPKSTFQQMYGIHSYHLLEPAKTTSYLLHTMARPLSASVSLTCSAGTKTRNGRRQPSTFLTCQGLQSLVCPPVKSYTW